MQAWPTLLNCKFVVHTSISDTIFVDFSAFENKLRSDLM